MGGGLLQLVAYGAQDAYITGNPHITFWKVLYKRHTNFAMEAMRVNFTGSPSYGQRSVVVVNRKRRSASSFRFFTDWRRLMKWVSSIGI